MKPRWELILINLMNERLDNRSMNLQFRPSPTIEQKVLQPHAVTMVLIKD